MHDGAWWKGIGLVLAGYVAFGMVLGVVSTAPVHLSDTFGYLIVMLVTCFGVTQMVWVVPILVWFRKEKNTLWGAIATAGILFMLNSACWGLFGLGGLVA